jgi:hypothetical protein
VPVVLLVTAAAIGVGMIVVAMGRGGEMAEFTADVRPVDAEIETATDVALLRPPAALWGYDKRATDQALNLVARTVTERDVEIATLRRQIADMQSAGDGRPAAGTATWPGQAAPPGGSGEPGQGMPPGQATEPGAAGAPAEAGPDSHASPFLRPKGSPAPPPPAEIQPWSAWDRPAGAPQPDQGEPGETG